MKVLILNLGFGEIFIISLIYVIFFGTKNLPSTMSDIGRFINRTKNSFKDVYNEFNSKK
ncbi:MAG: twin-arginine translocase TatA/TatE family subunit [Bacteroidota bacterium]|nr:twin-arginine translocase TatA/TatE family subunit [Bacteroidota bacterium]